VIFLQIARVGNVVEAPLAVGKGVDTWQGGMKAWWRIIAGMWGWEA
jgi:hypothetical protein